MWNGDANGEPWTGWSAADLRWRERARRKEPIAAGSDTPEPSPKEEARRLHLERVAEWGMR